MPDPPEWRTYPLDDEPDGADQPRTASSYRAAGTFPTYDPATERQRVRRRAGLLIGGATAVVALVGAVSWGVVAAVEGDGAERSTTTSRSVVEVEISGSTTISSGVDLFTDDGMDGLVEALRAETGSTEVLEVVLFPRWAVITVAGAAGPDRAPGAARVLKWDGTMTDAGTSFSQRGAFDLRELDGPVLADLCDGNTTTCTVVAGRPAGRDQAWLTVTTGAEALRTDLSGNPV